MSDDLKAALQLTATILTVLCAALAAATWWVSARATGSGGAGLVIIFPVIAAVGAHVVLGPIALILALLTRRFWRNAWIFGYFALVAPVMLIALRGGSPLEVLRNAVHDTLEERAAAREHPDETALCDALAHSLSRTGGTTVPVPLLEIEFTPDLDPGYRCWPRSVPLDAPFSRSLRNASFLRIAIAAGEMQVVDALLRRGVDVNAPGEAGLTPLLFALSGAAPISREGGLARRRHLAALRPRIDALLAAGADPTVADTSGVTPLHWAAALGAPVLVSRFLTAGTPADATAAHGGATPMRLAIGAVQVTIGTTAPRTERAAYYEDILDAYPRVMRQLLAAGAGLDAVLRSGGERGNLWLLGFLADEGIDLRAHVAAHGRDWLGVALHARDETWLRRLLAAGVDPGALDRRGDTLLHTFTYSGLEWQLDWALAIGVDLEARNSRGQTPLEVAVMHAHGASVSRLLEAGAAVTPEVRRRAGATMRSLLPPPENP